MIQSGGFAYCWRGWLVASVLLIWGTGRTGDETRKPIVVSPVQEIALGEKALEEFLAVHPRSTDGNLAILVDDVGRKVGNVSDRPMLLYRVMVVQGEEFQAYSFPGGTICLTESLAKLLGTSDKLAFAIGHEIAHVALRHHIFRYRLSFSLRGDVPPERVMLDTVMGLMDTDQELEADRYGALYTVRAGYDYSATYKALEQLAGQATGEADDSAHPDYAHRIRALKSFNRELERSLAAFHEGTAALRDGNTEQAISALKFFVAEFPNSVSGRVNLGSSYLAKVRQTAGTPLGLAEVLPILPDPGVVLRGFHDQVDLLRAREHFAHALDAEPNDVMALAGIALVEIRLGDLPRARQHLELALSVDPNNPELLLCSGNVHYVSDNFASAMVRYQAALTSRPGWMDAKKNLALTYQALGMIDGAISLWLQLEGNPRHRSEARRRLRDLTDDLP